MIMLNPNMLSKPELRKEFAKEYQKYYGTKIFEQEGFSRHTCKVCGMNFWSAVDRDVCEDSAHTTYSFFKEKPTPINYTDHWKRFAEFFKKNRHAVIDRYPVVSRWRQDLYFNIASILDFQRIENGRMSFEYSANPLVVPQICLRFGDIQNIGVTGGHFTSFMMAGQHAFDYPKHGYWRDRTIELNYKYLTEVLGIKKEEVVYHEDVWAMGDFSEFGPSLEFFSKGIELGNNVFTQFEYAGGKIGELEGKVVDVGWGFDRQLWYATGFDTAYEAVFHNVLEKLKHRIHFEFDSKAFGKFAIVAGELNVDEVKNIHEKEKELLKFIGVSQHDYQNKIKPMQAVYAILDHTRTLLFAISDGALPSNMGGGYNLRIILRRALDFMEKYKLEFTMSEAADLIAADLKPLFPELSDSHDIFAKVVEVEKARYIKSKENGRKIVEGLLAKSSAIEPKQLRTLYESNGVTPEFIADIAKSKNVELQLPENAYGSIVEGDYARKEKQKKLDLVLPDTIKPTKQLYYDFAEDANAKVVYSKDKYVVLDRTPFYPEGGGQDPDHGMLDGAHVVDVQKVGGAIVHVLAEPKRFKAGATVEAKVNVDRRKRLIAHHTATHLISAAARKILGKHAWQEGARKYQERAHIDVGHYDKLTLEEIKALEDQVNSWVINGIKVNAYEMERGKAEHKYGFSIYQGHGVPAREMRIIAIEDKNGNTIDAEACGGLHAVHQESVVGLIKIIDTSRPHDGIDRIEFVAGLAALDYFRKEHSELDKSGKELNVERLKVHEALARTLDEKNQLYKKTVEYREIVAQSIAKELGDREEVNETLDFPREMLRSIASTVTEKNKKSVVLLRNKEGDVVCIAGDHAPTGAIEFVHSRIRTGFKGGGSKKAAEGKILV